MHASRIRITQTNEQPKGCFMLWTAAVAGSEHEAPGNIYHHTHTHFHTHSSRPARLLVGSPVNPHLQNQVLLLCILHSTACCNVTPYLR